MTTAHLTTAGLAHERAVPQSAATSSWTARLFQVVHDTQAKRARREIARIAPFLPETVMIHGDLGRVTLGDDASLPFIR